MSKESIKGTIDANIKQNGQGLITGIVMNSVLKDMVDDEYSELGDLASKTDNLDAIVNGGEIERVTILTPSVGTFINTQISGTFDKESSPIENCNSYKIAVLKGEKYRIVGYGSSNAVGLYVLTDSNHNVVSYLRITSANPREVVELTIEQDGTLYVNNYQPQNGDGVTKYEYIKGGDGLNSRTFQLEKDMYGEQEETTIEVEPTAINGYFNTNGYAIGGTYDRTPTLNVEGVNAYKVETLVGEKYTIYGLGNTPAVALYVLTDSAHIILDIFLGDTRTDGKEITISQNGFLYVNLWAYNSATDKVMKYSKVQTKGIKQKVEESSVISPFAGKTIVCFGDSITGFPYNGKRYSDHLAFMSGANVINVANGGTRYAQRNTPTTNPSESNCWGALDMASLVHSAFVTRDFAAADACASYVDTHSHSNPQNKAVDAVNRLKAIDFSKVDVITFMGGTNDLGGGSQIGEETSMNVATLNGAINTIIEEILTAYPSIKIYFFTFPVKWTNDRTDSTWCDNSASVATYRNAIINGAIRNHIPIGDVYAEMGWTKYNFSHYFLPQDSTHPYMGFEEMARYIFSFLKSKQTF